MRHGIHPGVEVEWDLAPIVRGRRTWNGRVTRIVNGHVYVLPAGTPGRISEVWFDPDELGLLRVVGAGPQIEEHW